MFKWLKEREINKNRRKKTNDYINEVDDYLNKDIKEFYCAFGRLVNGETGKQVERDIFEASRGIRLALISKKSLLSILGSNQYPLTKSRFDDLMIDFEKVAELISDKRCSYSLKERREALLNYIGCCYS